MNLPIRVRLTLWYAAALATIIILLGTFLVFQLRSDLRQGIDEEAKASTVAITEALSSDDSDTRDQEPPNLAVDTEDFMDAAGASLPAGSGAQILDNRGSVLAAYGAAAGSGRVVSRLARAAVSDGRAVTRTTTLGEERQHYRVMVTPFKDHDRTRLVVVAVNLQRVEDAVRRVLVLLLIAGPVVLAATTVAAYWLARKALSPVERMTADAEEIGTAHLQERIAVPASRDELRRLADTLNAMLARIERSVMDKHRLIADASHQLRTPLAVMRAELDVSLRGDALPASAREVLESTREEVDRVSRAVDNLLALSAAEEGRLELLTVRVDVGQAMEDAAHPLRMLAAAKEVSLLVDGEPWEAQADRQRLHLALTNLIENAIKFTPAGGTVRVTSWRNDVEVGVTVSDEGPGIPAEETEHLFDRYYRVERSRTHNLGGSGLGLAICREVARAHGGRLWVDSELGAGSSFSLALPSSRAWQAEAAEAAITAVPSPRGELTPKE